MPDKKEAIEKLKKDGMRITQSREALIEFILKQKGHWNIQSVSEKVQRKHPKIGIATIYRTINLLVDEGFLNKTEMGAGPARFEVTSADHHDHLTCLDCGLIVEFENNKIEELQRKVAKELGFELVDHTMELYGKCPAAPNCKRKASPSH